MNCLRGLLLILCLACSVACSGRPQAPGAPAAGGSALVTLPNSVVVVADAHRVMAFTPEGKPGWVFDLPAEDQVAAPPVAALNSTTYVRGAKALYAIGADGKQIWEAKHADGAAVVKGLVPLGDSTVAATAGDNSLVGYTAEGQTRWTFTLPDGDRLQAAPAIGANSLVYLRGGKRLYAVDSQGNLSWQAPLGP
jgi:hypothetical protein